MDWLALWFSLQMGAGVGLVVFGVGSSWIKAAADA